jgi:hypothetical protein
MKIGFEQNLSQKANAEQYQFCAHSESSFRYAHVRRIGAG